MTEIWERDAVTPDEYHFVEAIRGREFIIRLTTGAAIWATGTTWSKVSWAGVKRRPQYWHRWLSRA